MFKKTGVSSLTALVLLTLAVPEIGQAIRLPAQAERTVRVTGSSRTEDQFSLPDQVAAETQVRIDGSSTMVVVNDILKQQFESNFSGTRVDIATNGTVPALERLLNEELDLVAVGRPLTEAERDRGLEQVTLNREKLAIIIGPDNPFDGNLTFAQFAQIFRGDITDWSDVGGEPGPIKFVDRPEDSDTRLAFAPYEAFNSAPFVSGPATVRVNTDETQEVIEALGANGISYAVASHVLDLDTVKIVPMHKTLPDDPAYPYSQPRAYVYLDPPNEAVQAFLGYGLADPGQTAIALAQETEAQAIASGLSLMSAVRPSIDDPITDTEDDVTLLTDEDSDNRSTVTTGEKQGATTSADEDAIVGSVTETDSVTADGNTVDDGSSVDGDGGNSPQGPSSLPMWLWWLLPLGALGLLVWGLLRRKDSEQTVSTETGEATSEEGISDLVGTGAATAFLTGVVGDRDGDVDPGIDRQRNPPISAGVMEARGETSDGGEVIETTDPTLGAIRADLDTGTALVAGLSFLNAGRTQDAKECLDEAVVQTPNDDVAWSLRGQALAEVGEWEQALESYDRALAIVPDSPVALTGKGGVLTQMGQAEGAIALYDQALDAHERQSDESKFVDAGLPLLGGTALTAAIFAAKGKALAHAGHSSEAINTLNRASSFNPDDPDIWTLRGDTLAPLEQPESALASYDRAIEQRAYSPAAYFGKAHLLSAMPPRTKEALRHYEWAATLTQDVDDNDGEDHPPIPPPAIEPSLLTPFLVGGVAMAGTPPPKVLLAKALAGQGRLLVDMGQWEIAKESSSSGISFVDSNVLEAEPTGQARVDQGLTQFETAIATNPQDAALYVERSMALAKVGNREGAIASLEQAESLNPHHPIIQLYKGHVLMNLDQPSAALAAYETSLSLDPENPHAILAKGTALDTLGHPEEAVVTFNQLIDEAIAPSTALLTQAATLGLPLLGANALKAHALKGKGNALIGLGYTGAGLDNLQQAVNTAPTNAQFWISQGNALNEMRQPDAAIASFERALELDPTATEALVGKGNGLMLLNQRDEAQSYFDQAALLGDDLSDVVLPADSDDITDQDTFNDRLSQAQTPGTQITKLATMNNSTNQGESASTRLTSTNRSQLSRSSAPKLSRADLANVDEGLPDLSMGYGESRIVLLPRDPQWAYTYWDIPNEHKQALRQQGGTQLVLRLYDITGVDLSQGNAHSMQQFDCDELAREWHLPIPVSDRDYVMEIGYITPDERWLMLARSQPVRVPPIYPSDWSDEQFIAVPWDEPLVGQTKFTLVSPETIGSGAPPKDNATPLGLNYIQTMRQAGSLFGSMHQIPDQGLSSFVFPSGAALETMMPTPFSVGNLSGMGMSGIGMSGIGLVASMPPIRSRKFWLLADAELIVYGATEPDATVTIGGQPIPLNPDGTFRFHMPFNDGEIDYPIVAVAADGEQTRSIHMAFDRDTPHQNTNTKAEAADEWF